MSLGPILMNVHIRVGNLIELLTLHSQAVGKQTTPATLCLLPWGKPAKSLNVLVDLLI